MRCSATQDEAYALFGRPRVSASKMMDLDWGLGVPGRLRPWPNPTHFEERSGRF